MARDDLEQQIARLAVLDEPARRSLYFYVARRQQEVSRDEAARALGMSRGLAGFHLDRLAEAGLLETTFRRLSGRAGPGAGRPAKLYRRSERQVEVTLPQRGYELAARILASAIDASKARPLQNTLHHIAHGIGQHIGAQARAQAGSRPGKKRILASAMAALSAHGYEPELVAGAIRLRNCPFHALVTEHEELVCGMNLALIQGVVGGLDFPAAKPVLAPEPGHCCVSIQLETK